jgi:hypothetical protein
MKRKIFKEEHLIFQQSFRKFKDRSTWLKAALIGLLVLAIAAGGCSSAKGQKLAERSEVLAAMMSMGYKFDETLISTEYGASPSQVIVTGPFSGPPRAIGGSATNKNKDLICPYSQAVLNKVGGKWVLAALEKRSLGWWPMKSSQEACSK